MALGTDWAGRLLFSQLKKGGKGNVGTSLLIMPYIAGFYGNMEAAISYSHS